MSILNQIEKNEAAINGGFSKSGHQVGSKYSTGIVKYSKVNAVITNAFILYQKLMDRDILGGLAVDEAGRYLAEVTFDDKTECAVYNPDDGKILAGVYTAEEEKMQKYGGDGEIAILSMMSHILMDEEARMLYEQVFSSLNTDKTISEADAKTMAQLCDNVLIRLKVMNKSISIKNNLSSADAFYNIKESSINTHAYKVAEEICGNIRVLVGKKAGAKKSVDVKTFNGKYRYTKNIHPDAQQVPDAYFIPSEIEEICTLISKSTNYQPPIRNVLLYGESGSGKTEGAKAIAAGLGLPYRTYTCHPQTDNYDLVGQFVPSTDNSSGTKDFVFVYSEIIDALKNGYLVEIQEPTVIVNEGTLVALNALLAGDYMTLANGERIQRHPDSVVIFTTNKADYAGYGTMSNSVLSRCSLVYLMDTPSIDEMVSRAMKRTGFTDKQMVEKMASVVDDIAIKLKNQGIKDGVTGFRELIQWITVYEITGDFYKSALPTIINKSTFDDSVRDEIQDIVMSSL